jgi:CheY-like chemotaxis protein
MSEALMGRLFVPFTQCDASTARRYGGTGLGLVITHRLAQLMGGDVTVSSRTGSGSVFTLAVECGRSASGAPACKYGAIEGADGAAVGAAPRRRRILFVDDHPLNRQVGRLFLEPEGYEVCEAENGLLALQKLDEGDFDLVLLDLHMPVLDGLQTLRRIRGSAKSWRTLPVVALATDALAGDRDRCLAAGMDGYVTKPLEQRDLLGEIAHLLAAAPPAYSAA